DEMMLALLRTDTEFAVNDAVDPAEFVALYKTFRTKPVYRIGAKVGSVAAAPSVVSADFVDDGTNNTRHSFGFTGTLASEIPLRDKMQKFTLAPEINFQLLSFRGQNELGDTARVTPATEKHAWLSIPVSLQYTWHPTRDERSHYYVSAGRSADYLLSASKPIVSNREGNSAVDESTIP